MRYSFRTNSNYSTISGQANANYSEPIWKKIWISFVENRLKINPTQSETSIRMNPNEFEWNFQSEWIQTPTDLHRIFNPNQSDWIRVWMDLDWKFCLDQPESGLILIRSDEKLDSDSSDWSLILSRINFQMIFNKRDWKLFSDWFGLIRSVSDTDFGMLRNRSNWLGMNSYPKFSPKRFYEKKVDNLVLAKILIIIEIAIIRKLNLLLW